MTVVGRRIPSEPTLQAEFHLEFPYTRSVGPVIQRFLQSLGDRKIMGIRTETSGVMVPPTEYDPQTSAELGPDDMVEVGPGGEIVSWTWVANPKPGQPLAEPFAFALVKPDGADIPMLAAVAAPGPDALATGQRVTARWADETVGDIVDLVCFDPEEAS